MVYVAGCEARPTGGTASSAAACPDTMCSSPGGEGRWWACRTRSGGLLHHAVDVPVVRYESGASIGHRITSCPPIGTGPAVPCPEPVPPHGDPCSKRYRCSYIVDNYFRGGEDKFPVYELIDLTECGARSRFQRAPSPNLYARYPRRLNDISIRCLADGLLRVIAISCRGEQTL